MAEKDFLRKLYQGNEGVAVLMLANEKSLNALIQILHLLAIGEIPMRKDDENVLKSAKKYNKLRHFMLKDFFRQLLHKANRETKIKELKPFIKLYPAILYLMFNDTSSS